MPKSKHSKRVHLTAEEISIISISLREYVKSLKKLKTPNSYEQKEYDEYLREVEKLQSRFQHLAVRVEKEVLNDIKNIIKDLNRPKNSFCKY